MKVRLHDIAARLGIAPSTVQRALSGNAGVGPKLREEIRQTAAEMGYVPNYHASSLKRGSKRIAVILPDRRASNRYFSDYLWQGVRQNAVEASTLDIDMIELAYSNSPDGQLQLMEAAARGEYGKLDGIITRGTTDTALEASIAALHDEGIPVALIGLDIESRKRIFCIKNYEGMQGNIAADLLIQFGSVSKQRKMIVYGNFSGFDQYNNAKGFERKIWESRLPIDIHMVSYQEDAVASLPILQRELESNVPVYAIYTCSTRGTVAVANLLEKTGAYHKIRLIGSDVFHESADFLRRGVIKALLNSRPREMAYRASRALTTYLRNPGIMSEAYTEFIEPSVVLSSNIPVDVE